MFFKLFVVAALLAVASAAPGYVAHTHVVAQPVYAKVGVVHVEKTVYQPVPQHHHHYAAPHPLVQPYAPLAHAAPAHYYKPFGAYGHF